MARTRRGDAELFFRDLTRGGGGGLREADDGEAIDEAEAFFAELTGKPRPVRRALGLSEDAAEAAPGPFCACTDHGLSRLAEGNVWTHNLIAARASIKTRYAKLCCEGTSDTSWAFSAARTGVVRLEPVLGALIGYIRHRTFGGTAINTYRYWSIYGTVYNTHFEPAVAPADNSVHNYSCEVDPATGRWTFHVDGTFWDSITDAAWVGRMGTRADYTGLVRNVTDDMPGTASNKCIFRSCEKKSSPGAWVDAGLTTSNVGSSDPGEWGATRLSSRDMDIWDKNPNP